MIEIKYGVWYLELGRWCNGIDGKRLESTDVNEVFHAFNKYFSHYKQYVVEEIPNEK